MFQVCICDDNLVFLEEISRKVYSIAQKNQLDVDIHRFTDGKAMLFQLEEDNVNVDIFFLDVLMGEVTGIEVAERLREWGSNAQIIFLTSSKEHVFEALDVMPLHYLIKQELDDQVIEKILLKAVDLTKKSHNESFSYKSRSAQRRVDINSIEYFEITNRVVTIHFTDKHFDQFYSTMEKLEKMLNSARFVRIHRSFLVNLSRISAIEGKSVICSDQTEIPIGDKYLSDLKKKYAAYVLQDMDVL